VSFFSQHIDRLPPPSPEAVQSIGEVIDRIDKGDRKGAAWLLEHSYRIVSPIMMAAGELQFLNELLDPSRPTAVRHPSRMQFDWVHYADAAIQLDLVGLIENENMLESIAVVRQANLALDTPRRLTRRYRRSRKRG
jgi:hypothetical protein